MGRMPPKPFWMIGMVTSSPEKEPTYAANDINTESREVLAELEKHKKWMATNKMLPTPRVFINGRILPSNYSLEDFIAMI